MRQIRRLLGGLLGGPRSPEPLSPYAELLPLARAALRGVPAAAWLDAEDLCDDLLCDLLQSPAELRDLLALDDTSLRQRLRRRLRHLAAEKAHAWGLRKRLREIVVQCLDRLPEAPAALPPALTHKGRIQRELVAGAVAFLLKDAEGGATRDPGLLAQELLQIYFPPPMATDGREVEDGRHSEEVLLRHIRVKSLVREMPQHVRRGVAELMARCGSGATLDEIARGQGVAVSTVHARLAAAREELRTWLQEKGVGFTTADALFNLFAAREGKAKAEPALDETDLEHFLKRLALGGEE